MAGERVAVVQRGAQRRPGVERLDKTVEELARERGQPLDDALADELGCRHAAGMSGPVVRVGEHEVHDPARVVADRLQQQRAHRQVVERRERPRRHRRRMVRTCPSPVGRRHGGCCTGPAGLRGADWHSALLLRAGA
jgi:hypothetical protein